MNAPEDIQAMSVESGTVALLNKSEIDMQVATAHKYPRNTCGQYIHIKTAESVLGCPLPPGAVVHHFDGNRNNNANSNLVVCPSQKYHKLLHIRTRALDECGNAEFRKCRYCKSYDDPVELFSYENKDGTTVSYHRECHRAANKAAYQSKNKESEMNQ